MSRSMVVQKFGSSVLTDRGQLPVAVHDVYRALRHGHEVVVVVSAIGRHTDLLLSEAEYFGRPSDAPDALAQLLATGETQSAALLSLALQRAGVPATLLDTASLGLIARGDRLNAEPVSVDAAAIRQALTNTPVVVIPGFAARHEDGGLALMGRGGSDLTAVFLAQALNADECRLVKDVDGIYEHDPAKQDSENASEAPHRYGTITYADALRVAQVLVQPKAVEFLQQHNATAEVTALLHDHGTTVGAASTTVFDSTKTQPLKVLVLGFGALGQCVVECMDALPNEFSVVGIGVRHVQKHTDNPVAGKRLTANINQLLRQPHDALIELTGDQELSEPIVARYLDDGIPVITANQALAAPCGIKVNGASRWPAAEAVVADAIELRAKMQRPNVVST